MSATPFHAVLLDISKNMDAGNLRDMKYLAKDVIKKREAEDIETGHQLFELLEERGKLAADNTDYLSGLLRNIHREDLQQLLTNFTSQAGPGDSGLDQQEEAKLDAAVGVIADNLGRDWRKLGRRLGVKEVKLDSISRQHPADLEETVRELLKQWRRARGAEARAEQLVQALRLCRFNLTADKVEDQLKELLPPETDGNHGDSRDGGIS